MPAEKVEIVYRVKSDTCLYFEGFSSELQMPIRTTSITMLRCEHGVYVVPRIPGREIARIIGLDGVETSDLLPPCDLLDRIKREKGVVELADFTELRYISFIDRMTGLPVRCYIILAKPSIVYEGRIIVKDPCRAGRFRTVIEKLYDTLVIGGMRLLGCGFVEPVYLAVKLPEGLLEFRDVEEAERLVCSE